MEVNEADGGDRQFILVQAPENSKPGSEAMKAGLETISHVTAERVKRAAKKLAPKKGTDVGFRLYRTAASNLRKYQPKTAQSVQDLNSLDFTGAGALVPDYKTRDVLTELMLMEGFPLDSEVKEFPDFHDEVHVVTHPERSYRLLVCLSTDTLSDATVEEAAKYPKDTFVCLESSLNDQLKLRLADAVENVKTL